MVGRGWLNRAAHIMVTRKPRKREEIESISRLSPFPLYSTGAPEDCAKLGMSQSSQADIKINQHRDSRR
jgi:hypothetical protein